MTIRRDDPEVERLWQEFHELVNMPSPELRAWLMTDASGEEAYADEASLDVPELSRAVLRVLGKRRVDLTDADVDVMSTVTGLIRERLDNRPAQGASDTAWRHALMSLGHDPLIAEARR